MYIDEWTALNSEEKKGYIQELIEKNNLPFKVEECRIYEENNRSFETVVLSHEKKAFVFVPGAKDIILGWDITSKFSDDMIETYRSEWTEGIVYYKNFYAEIEKDYRQQIEQAKSDGTDDGVLIEEMQELLSEMQVQIDKTFEIYIQEIYDYMQGCMSPVRTACIRPMIVECECSCRTISSLTNSQMVAELANSRFSIVSEDEWEYLCGGGARTFFRWGNTLSNVRDEMFEDIPKGQEVIAKPNLFGLTIQCMNEITSQDNLYKGGDGGCALCGGDGIQPLSISYSTFYRHIADYRILSLPYRRIIRL